MGIVVYKNARIIRGHKAQPIIEEGTIIVDDKGILGYVGSTDEIPHSTYDKIIDLEGRYVMPGLINAHAHFFNSGKPMDNFPDILLSFAEWFLKTWIGKIYLKIGYKQNYRTALNAGITTVRDTGSFYYNDIRCREYFNKKAKKNPMKCQIGPRILACGRMITATGGHGYYFPDRRVADDPWDDRKAVRETIIHEVDQIKICNTEGISDATFIGEAGKVSMTTEEIQAACSDAHSRYKLVATHCESTEGLKRALLAGVDTIEHGARIPEDMIALFLNNPNALRGYTALVPTLSAFFIPDLEHKLKPTEENHIIIENTKLIGESTKEGFLTAVHNGIPIGVGNDASVPRVTHYDLYKELLYMQEFAGLTNQELIHMATVDTAKILGIEDITGTLEAGKSADFIVLDKNPLEDLHNLYKPRHVVARGHCIMKPRFKVFRDV